MIIFIDNERKYKFLIGYNIKIGQDFYRIDGIEKLRHEEALTALATVTASTYDFSTYLKPLDGYMYFIEKMGIDGFCGFALQFPKGIVHGAPRGETEYVYKDEAGKLNPEYYPFIITTPNYPTWAYYNPTTATNTSYAYFKGERWKVHKINSSELTGKDTYIELLDYTNGGIGQG